MLYGREEKDNAHIQMPIGYSNIILLIKCCVSLILTPGVGITVFTCWVHYTVKLRFWVDVGILVLVMF